MPASLAAWLMTSWSLTNADFITLHSAESAHAYAVWAIGVVSGTVARKHSRNAEGSDVSANLACAERIMASASAASCPVW